MWRGEEKGYGGRGSRKCQASGMQHAAPPLSEPDRPSKRIVIANGRARKHNNTTPAPAPAPTAAPATVQFLLQLFSSSSPSPFHQPFGPESSLLAVAESNAICLPPLV